MDQFFSQLPPRVLAIGAIVVGLILILLNDPPRSMCDKQLDVFRQQQRRFLFRTADRGVARRPTLETQMDVCRGGNSPGACSELFASLRRFVIDVDTIPEKCASEAAKIGELRGAIWTSLELMALVAWGEKPPLTYAQRNGWLDMSDVALYCRLRQHALELYGGDAWLNFRQTIMRRLPKATTMSPDQAWQRSLLSTPCDSYR